MAETTPGATASTQPAAPPSGPPVSRGLAVLMLAEAATLGVASYLHLDGRIPLGFATISGEHFPRAALPEAIIGGVLAASAAYALAARAGARAVALSGLGFAIAGVIIGVTVLLTGSRPDITADLVYHAAVLAALAATAGRLLARRGGAGLAGTGSRAGGSAPGRRKGAGGEAQFPPA